MASSIQNILHRNILELIGYSIVKIGTDVLSFDLDNKVIYGSIIPSGFIQSSYGKAKSLFSWFSKVSGNAKISDQELMLKIRYLDQPLCEMFKDKSVKDNDEIKSPTYDKDIQNFLHRNILELIGSNLVKVGKDVLSFDSDNKVIYGSILESGYIQSSYGKAKSLFSWFTKVTGNATISDQELILQMRYQDKPLCEIMENKNVKDNSENKSPCLTQEDLLNNESELVLPKLIWPTKINLISNCHLIPKSPYFQK